jgi:hypothetical protein
MYQGMIVRCAFNHANVTPMRRFDYQAWIEGREENERLYGYGETRGEALMELGAAIVERVDDHLYDMAESGAISQDVADECFVDIDGLTYVPY